MGQYLDYVGFTIDNIHSSDLGILRISSGNRYSDISIPTFSDRVVQVGGRDGTYYFGSNFQKKDIVINFAFDNLNEQQIRRIQTLWLDNKMHKLVYDETPYKYYNVKLSSPIEFKYLTFDEYNMQPPTELDNAKYRVYKGEGVMKLINYECFGRGTVKSLADISATDEQFHNIDEWQSIQDYNLLPSTAITVGNEFTIFNAGEIEMPVRIYIPVLNNDADSENGVKIRFVQNGEDVSTMVLSGDLTLLDNDVGIVYDSELNVLLGYKIENNKSVPSNNIYNKYIEAGDFYRVAAREEVIFICENIADSAAIEYEYRYL